MNRLLRRCSPVTSGWVVLLATALPLMSAHAQVAVSDGGTPGYSMAIAVPPGISGMAPNLGLAFSAGGVNGPVGAGWSVQGMSLITRCAGIRASDGAVKGVAFGPTDKLCLDGQRLIQTTSAGVPVAANPTANGALTDANGLAEDGYSFTEYRTEKDTFARVRAYGSASGAAANGPRYFKVWTKSGQVYEYGASPSADANTNALVAGQGSSIAVAWSVARISDTLGNYIDFKYNQRDVTWGSGPTAGVTPGHEWNLVEVQYAGNSNLSQAPTNKVIFEYEDRGTSALTLQDRSEAYHNGKKNVSVQRLKAIRTYINWPGPALGVTASPAGVPVTPPSSAVKVRTYKLAYDASPATGRSRLTSITECAGAAESACLPPTSFAYGPTTAPDHRYVENMSFTNNSALSRMVMQDTSGAHGVITGDFFGDGRQSFIRWGDSPAENQLWHSDGSGNFVQVPGGTGAGQFNITDENLFKSDGCYYSLVVDINGDGLPDILRYSASKNAAGTTCGTYGPIYVYLNKGDGSFTRTTLSGPTLNRTVSTTIPKPKLPEEAHPGWSSGANFFFMDVDGDGKLDIVNTILPFYSTLADPTDPCLSVICTEVWKGNGDGSFTSIPTNLAHTSVYVKPTAATGIGLPRNTVDANGDGLADLVNVDYRYFTHNTLFYSNGDGNFTGAGSAQTCDQPLDFNGDGRSDCLIPSADGAAGGNNLTVGTGAASVNVAAFNLHAAGQELSSGSAVPATLGVTIIDVNGDGRSDILRWGDSASNNALYVSNGDGTFTPSTTFNLNTVLLRRSDAFADFIVGDFTGHGNAEILRLVADANAGNKLYVRSDSTPADQLLTVTSPSGLVSRLTYVPLGNSSSGTIGNRYRSARSVGATTTYPKFDIVPPMYVVATLEADTGVGSSTIKTEYMYSQLRASADGRGVLGFGEISQQSFGPNGSPITVITTNVQDHPYIGVVGTKQTIAGAIGQSSPRISRTTNAYCDTTSASAAPTVTAGGSVPVYCATTSLVQRPYLAQSFEEGWDVDAATTSLPSVRTTNTFNGSGDALTIVTSTTGSSVGVAQTSTKTVTNSYFADQTSGDLWVLGRLQSTSVQSQITDMIASVSTSAGSAPYASNRTMPAATFTASPSPLIVQSPAPTAASGVVTFSNTSATAFTLSLTASGGNTLSVASLNCPANASCGSVTVTSPTTLGYYSGELTATPSNGGTPISVPLSMSVLTAPSISSTPTAFASSTTTAPLAGSASVSLSNTGEMPTTLTLSTVGGTSVSPTVLSCPGKGVCGTVTVTTPTAAGTYDGNLNIVSSAGGSVPSVAITMKVLTAAAVTASPASLSSVQTAPTAAGGTVTFTNSGQTATNLTLSITGGASLSTTTLSCPVQASCGSVTVTSPTGAGDYSGTLSATSSSTGIVTQVPLTLTVRTPPSISATPSPNPLNQTTVTPTAASGTVTFSNSGQTPTTLNLTLSGGASLSTSTLSCPASGACGTVTVTTPSAAGDYTGSLSITSTAGGSVPGALPVSLKVLSLPNISATSSPSPFTITVTSPTAASGTATLTNSGQTATTLNLSVTGGASLSSSTLSCPANGTCGTVTITTPTAAGNYSGALNMSSNAGGTVTSVPLSLNVLTPPNIAVVTSPSPLTTTTVTPNAGGGTATFTNNGQTPTTLTLSMPGVTVSPSALSCPANGSCGSVSITSPTGAGSYGGAMSIASSAGGSVPSVSGTFNVLTLPNVQPSVGTLSSSTTSPTAASGTVSFSNSGQTATSLSFTVTGGSTVSPTTLACPANGSCGSVTVTSPTAAGTYNGSLTASSSAGGTVGSVSVAYSVAAAVPANITLSPTSIAFGQVVDGSSINKTMTVTNTGGAGVLSVSITGANASQYKLTSASGCTVGAVMAANSSCTLTLTETGKLYCSTTVSSPVSLSATISVTVGSSNKTAALSGTNYKGPAGCN